MFVVLKRYEIRFCICYTCECVMRDVSLKFPRAQETENNNNNNKVNVRLSRATL